MFSAYINCNLDPISKTIWLIEDDLEVIDGTLSLRLQFKKGITHQHQDTEEFDGRSESEEEFKETASFSEFPRTRAGTNGAALVANRLKEDIP